MTASQEKWASRALLGVALLLAVLVGFVRDFSGDFHWHIVLGGDMLDTHSLYTHDRHSHTFFGKEVLISAWLSDVFYALSYRLGGYPGCYTLRALALVLMTACLFTDSRRRGAGVAGAFTLVVCLLTANLFRFYLRPETLALGLFGALLLLLGNHERTGKRRYLVFACLLPLPWANLHGSVSIGLLAIGLYCAQRVIAELKPADRERDLSVLISCFVAPPVALLMSCGNPEGIFAAFAGRVTSPIWVSTVYEWTPLPFHTLPPMVLLFALASALSLILAIGLRRKTSPWLLLLLVVLGFLTLRYRRFLTFWLIASVPFIAAHVGIIARSRLVERRPLFWRRAGQIICASASVLALSILVFGHKLPSEVGLTMDAGRMTEGACKFLKKQNLPGPLFNSYGDGSFLMHCLGPSYPVFIDGRAWSLYTEEFYGRYLAAGKNPALFAELLLAHPIRWAIVAYDPFAAQFLHNRRFRLVYFDDQSLVFADSSDPANKTVIAEHGFELLPPPRLISLVHITPDKLPAARRELDRLVGHCATCMRTQLAAAALAIASGDDDAFQRARDAVLTRGEPNELPFLAATHAYKRGDMLTAARLFARWREIGGDPIISSVEQARALAAVGQRGEAEKVLEAARKIPGAAPVIERVREEILNTPVKAAP